MRMWCGSSPLPAVSAPAFSFSPTTAAHSGTAAEHTPGGGARALAQTVTLPGAAAVTAIYFLRGKDDRLVFRVPVLETRGKDLQLHAEPSAAIMKSSRLAQR